MKVYEAVLEQLFGAGVTHFAGMVGSTSAPYASALASQTKPATSAFATNKWRRRSSMRRRASAASLVS